MRGFAALLICLRDHYILFGETFYPQQSKSVCSLVN